MAVEVFCRHWPQTASNRYVLGRSQGAVAPGNPSSWSAHLQLNANKKWRKDLGFKRGRQVHHNAGLIRWERAGRVNFRFGVHTGYHSIQCGEVGAESGKVITNKKGEKQKGSSGKSNKLWEAMQSAGTLDMPPLSQWNIPQDSSASPNATPNKSQPPVFRTSPIDLSDSGRHVTATEESPPQPLVESILTLKTQASVAPDHQTYPPPKQTARYSSTSDDPQDSLPMLNEQSSSGHVHTGKGDQMSEAGPSDSGQSTPEMELLFLGTSSGQPTRQRNVSGLLLRMRRGAWLFDCGEGTQHRLLQARVSPCTISKIFISHMHGDHIFGLPGLLLSIMDSRDEIGRGQEEILHIYGPKGLGRYIWANLSMSASGLTLPVTVHELGLEPHLPQRPLDSQGRFRVEPVLRIESREGESHWDLFDDENISVRAALLKHRVPCYGYVIEEVYERRVDRLRARGWGIEPGPAFAKLERGETVRLPDGSLVQPADVLEQPQRRKVCILGDTCDSSNIVKVAQDSDILVHEATFENKYGDKAMLSTHSTAGMAGAFAREIGAKNLVLTHFSKRYENFESGVRNPIYEDGSDDEGEDSQNQAVKRLVAQARQAFRCSRVLAAEDFTRVEVLRSPFAEATV